MSQNDNLKTQKDNDSRKRMCEDFTVNYPTAMMTPTLGGIVFCRLSSAMMATNLRRSQCVQRIMSSVAGGQAQ
jgi:hypothetical protein